MTNIAITHLNDGTSTRLRDRAAANGRSVEEEACLLISRAIGHAPCWRDLASIIRSRFGPANGVDLALPSRAWRSVAGLPDAMRPPD